MCGFTSGRGKYVLTFCAIGCRWNVHGHGRKAYYLVATVDFARDKHAALDSSYPLQLELHYRKYMASISF